MSARRLAQYLSLAVLGVAVTGAACSRAAERPVPAAAPPLGTSGAPSTDRAALERVVTTMERKLAAAPTDAKAAVMLSDALLRQTRVTGNAGLAMRAEAALTRVLGHDPDNYDARRMLATVYLSQHRFREALREAQTLRDRHPKDAWIYGAVGDAHIELGEYDAAFAAFDRMAALKPNAASYARASYARELSGDLSGARRLMQMAADATSPQDPESLAWHYAQLGHLDFEMGRLDDARREFAHADYAFPGHPFASEGLARLKAAAGDYAGALDLVTTQLASVATPADLALSGDLLSSLGRHDEAEQRYRLAEAAWQSDAPEPSRLARFLAERGRHLDRAIQLAETVATDRRDIFTEDALAWAYLPDRTSA